MKKFYIAICDLLRQIEAIKWIDMDSGQLDAADSSKALKYPCALIKYTGVPTNVDELGEMQDEAITFDIRLAFDATGSRTNAAATETALDRSLAFIDIAESVYTAIQGQAIDDLDRAECVYRGQEPPKNGLNIIKMTFKTSQYI